MKIKICVIVVAVTLAFAFSAFAGGEYSEKRMSVSAAKTGQVEHASDIIGRSVQTPKGDVLGEIQDIVLDQRSGRIAYMVLSTKRFLGMKAKIIPVPWKAFKVQAEGRSFVLNIRKDQLKRAPTLEEGNVANKRWGAKVHEFYGLRPYWEEETPMQRQEEMERMREMEPMEEMERRY
jgi:sporulation protein YlmC with PRC-barrel domain